MYRNIENRIIQLEDLKAIRGRANRTKSTVVFTEGFWDLFHNEHAAFLMNCAKLGDWLIAGVVCDSEMRPNKGRDPVYDENRRLYTVASHCCVDWAVLLRDPADAILPLKPDILAISAQSLPDRNAWKVELAKQVGARLVRVGSRNTIHSSEVAKQLTGTG